MPTNKPSSEAETRVAVNMRLPTDLLNDLRAEAEKQDRSVTSIIIEAITNYLDRDKNT